MLGLCLHPYSRADVQLAGREGYSIPVSGGLGGGVEMSLTLARTLSSHQF